MAAPNDLSILRPGQNGAAASLTRVGFGTTEVETARETQGSALAARAQAEVQARYIVALQRPRNLEQFRARLLEHCKRPGFAEIASYAKPVGGELKRGPSIRFVETALQEYGNVIPDETITYDDDYRRITRVSVTDLERNITYDGDVITEKTVERRSPRDGDEVLGSRRTSEGNTVYKVRATEDDFATKCAAACAKKARNLGLKIIPRDIVDEAGAVCRATRETVDAKDPSAARRAIADSFVSLRVFPIELDAFLGHPFDQASPAELDELRAAYVAIRDGEARWVDLVEFQRQKRGEVAEASKPAAAAGDKLRARVEQVRKKTEEKLHKVVDVTAEQKPTPAPARETAPASGAPIEVRDCAMCGDPIEVPINAKPGARCQACAAE
jgi:hypothetical protein